MQYSSSANQTLSGAITGLGTLTKDTGAGVLTLSGTDVNTYSGLTTVSAGTLVLNKSDNTNAIGSNVGGGGGDKVTDVQINSGGTVNILANEQIIDTAYITVGVGGTLNFSTNAAHTETIWDLNNFGTVDYGAGAVDIADPTWNIGSTNTISGTSRFGNLLVHGGTNNINAGANLQIGSGNLEFTNNTNITVAGSAGTPGTLRLGRTKL